MIQPAVVLLTDVQQQQQQQWGVVGVLGLNPGVHGWQ
jgi:hypothetical protein